MYSHGVTINLGDYQSERIDVTYPFEIPPTEQGYNDAVLWVKSRLQCEIDAVVRRERVRGNHLAPPRVVPEGDATATLPAALQPPHVPAPPVGGNINPSNGPVVIPACDR